MQTTTLTVTNEVGLHARPAAQFVKAASRYKSKIQVRNITNGKGWADAKSILKVLALGVEKDNEIEIQAEGGDENEAIQALEELIHNNMGE